MKSTKALMQDEFSRTIQDDNGVSVGKIIIHLSYNEVFDDGQDDEDSPQRYVPNPISRENEHFKVTVEGPRGSVESETVYTGEAMAQIVELFRRLDADARKL